MRQTLPGLPTLLFGCGPAGESDEKNECVTYVVNNTVTKLPNFNNLRAFLRGAVTTERLSFLILSHKNKGHLIFSMIMGAGG
jgi:hypothetical protein